MAGLGLDDVENILAKGFDHLLGLDRPNAAIYSSAEVLFNSIYGSRSRCLHELIFELLLPHSPDAVIHSPVLMIAAWP
jgi:hypothetical protein